MTELITLTWDQLQNVRAQLEAQRAAIDEAIKAYDLFVAACAATGAA